MTDQPCHILKLRYGINPHQINAELKFSGPNNPLSILSGTPSYINLLDALRGWALVRELRNRLGRPAAASFKHVNPAGVGLGGDDLGEYFKKTHFLPDWELSPLAIAYLRARQADRIASYGDFVALSDEVDIHTATILKTVASDGVIAPSFSPDALELLRTKKSGKFIIMAIDWSYNPNEIEIRDEYGLILSQPRDQAEAPDLSENLVVTSGGKFYGSLSDNMLLALITAKYTQSNAVVISCRDQTIGIGAGQQSRISATKLACAKAENSLLYSHPNISSLVFREEIGRIDKMNIVENLLNIEELDQAEKNRALQLISSQFVPLSKKDRRAWIQKSHPICLASDAAIPFRDNIDRAARAGVTHIIQTGGSKRDQEVIDAANEHDIVMMHTGVRYFLH